MEVEQNAITFGTLDDFKASKPGIYKNVPEGIYHALDAMSNSRMSVLDEYAPAKLKHEMDNGSTFTDSKRLGSLFHHLLLEPEMFALSGDPSQTPRYTWHVWPPGQAFRSNADKALREEMHTLFGEDRCIRHGDFEAAKAMVSSAKTYLKEKGLSIQRPRETELSILWTDQATGLLAKARLDLLFTDTWDTLDVKSTRSASRLSFRRDIKKYGYHRQGPWYHSGLFEHGIVAKDHIIFAVESPAPHLCAWRTLGPASAAQGWIELERLRSLYAECKRNNHWPGYDPGPIELDTYHIESVGIADIYDPIAAL